MASKEAIKKVQDKFDLAGDVKNAKIKTSIYRVEQIDGKFKADFEISGLPGKKGGNNSMPSYEDRNKTIPKIFNTVGEFTAYAEKFFAMSDEEIIKLCKES